MHEIHQAFAASSLFVDFPDAELKPFLEGLQVTRRMYGRDGVIAFEEDTCTSLGIVVQGSIRIQRIYPGGRSITINTLLPTSSFGEALIFADDRRYPATLIANEETVVLFITREAIAQMCMQSSRFLNNFMKLLSNRIII